MPLKQLVPGSNPGGGTINKLNYKNMIKSEEKSKIIKKHSMHEEDTGGAEVQVGLLTEEIKQLLSHLKKHPKDLHSKRGLLKMVSRRRKLLKFLKGKDESSYKKTIEKVGLKK